MKEFKFFRGYKDEKWWDTMTNTERRVFTINVGNLSQTEIDVYIRRIQGNFNTTIPIVDYPSILERSRS
jgi:hypothetical protein